MGMTNDNIERPEREEPQLTKKKEEPKVPLYIICGPIYLNNELVQLLVGEDDHKWYKSKCIGSYQIDPRNNSPTIPKFSDVIEPFSEEDKKYWDFKI